MRELRDMECGSDEWDELEDGPGYGKTEGEVWIHCRRCDVWTAFAPELKESSSDFAATTPG
jgi:hypothetical protein